MEKEHVLSPKDSLALISDVINKTNDNIRQHSFVFILWGWLISGASVLRFTVESAFDLTHFIFPFPLAAVTGIIITINYYKKAKQTSPETYLNQFIRQLWFAIGIAFAFTIFVSVFQGIQPFTYTLVLAGIGTLATGLVTKFKPLQFGAAIFLTSSVICAMVPDSYKVLVHGIAIIPGYLIPGYMLRKAKG
jgi:hypothetical protein